jgi:hypothetical protein
MIPANYKISGTLKVKDAPAFFEAIFGKVRPPWYRRIWNWIRWRGRGRTHKVYWEGACISDAKGEPIADVYFGSAPVPHGFRTIPAPTPEMIPNEPLLRGEVQSRKSGPTGGGSDT